MPGFPEEPIELLAEIAAGADLTADPLTWVWTSLTCPHPSDPARTISRLVDTATTTKKGVAVGATNTQTSTATIELFNHDGVMTPAHPGSPFWPYLDSGTPMRLRMRTRTTAYLTDTFTRTVASTWGTTDTGNTYTYSGGTSFSVNGTQGLISFASANLIRNAKSALSLHDVDVTFDVAVGAVSASIPTVFGPHIRQVDASNYLWPSVDFMTGGTVQLQARNVVGGSIGFLGSNTSTGVTYTAGTMIRCRVQVVEDRVRMKVWLAGGAQQSAWHLDVRQQTYPLAGAFGWLGWVPAGNTNTYPYVMTVDNISVTQPPYDRVEGYIADIRPRFIPQPDGSTWSTVLVDIAGIGSRLEKNQSPDCSPMRRSVQLSYPPPIAYWPLEDAEEATSGASAFPGLDMMLVTGPAVFAFTQSSPADTYQSRFGTKPMVSVAAGAKLTGIVPASTVQTEWAVSVVAGFYVPGITPVVTEMRILEWQVPASTFNRWAFVGTTTGYKVRAYNDAAGTSTDVVTFATVYNARQNTYTVEASQSGGNINVGLFINDNAAGTGSVTGTLANVTRVTVNPDQSNVTASVTPDGLTFITGHVRVVTSTAVRDLPFYPDPDTGILVYAGNAWYLESAHQRLNRLCAEERVPFQWIGVLSGGKLTQLNAQRDGSFSDLLTQAVASESGGLLFEDGFGYTYLPRSQRYNQPTTLTINMAAYNRADGTDQADVLVPQLDSRATNAWTVTRYNGSSGSDAAPAAYRQLRGTIAEETVVDVLYDASLNDHASWRLHTSIDGQGANYPSIPLDLGANPALIDAYLGCRIGSRVQRTNQPLIAGVGVIDQVIEGITETITPTSWTAELTCTPASVWNIAVYDDPSRRKDSSSTTTNATYAAGVVSIVFKTTNVNDTWGTVAPYDCVCLGEKFTVTTMGAVTGTGPYLQPATVVRAVNGIAKSWPAGSEIHIHPDMLARWAL